MTAPNLSPYDLDAIQARVDLIAGFETNRTERDRAALLALVREQQARLDKVARIAASMDRIADFHFEVLGQVDSMGISLRQHAEDIRAALIATEGS
jgi:hypothetical protein